MPSPDESTQSARGTEPRHGQVYMLKALPIFSSIFQFCPFTLSARAEYIANMIIRIPFLLSCLAFASSVQGLHIPGRRSAPQPTSYIVHQFPDKWWVENIVVRQSGDLLVTILTQPYLFLIDPLRAITHPGQDATLVYSFEPFGSLLGITETEPDRFYVVASNASSSPDFAPGSYTIVSVDLTNYNAAQNSGVVTKEVAKFPQAGVLNGLATLDASRGLIIIADSTEGAIYVLDVNTGKSSTLLQDQETAVPAGGQLGVNGLKVLPIKGTDNVYVYFDNTDASLLCRVPISLSTLETVGPVETLQSGYSADDFALDVVEGFAYMADGMTNSLNRVPLAGGKVTTVLGGINDTIIEGPTSVAIGRGVTDEVVKYITTNGGILNPINGFTEGGRVVGTVV
jgi:hypothetical protein